LLLVEVREVVILQAFSRLVVAVALGVYSLDMQVLLLVLLTL
jgi:hypothetical protein